MTLTQSRERWSKLSPNIQGALWLLLSCLGFSVMATFVKFAAREVSPFEITFFRCFFGLLVLAPVIAWYGIGALRTRHLGMHAWRGILGATAMGCAYFGLSRMPLAAYNALSFSKPLFAIVLAVFVLHETVRWRRWAATFVGFLGVHGDDAAGHRGVRSQRPVRAGRCPLHRDPDHGAEEAAGL